MTISTVQKQLVQESFAQVAPVADQTAALFYSHLFTLEPSLRLLFSADLADQRRKLMQMLGVAVHGLDDLEALVPSLQQLAVRHVGYGVRNEHYETVGDALLWALEQSLGEAFTDEVRTAWAAVYGLVSSVMIEAAQALSMFQTQDRTVSA